MTSFQTIWNKIGSLT